MSAQEDETGHGKVIKISPTHEISVYAKGFRNPQGLAFNTEGQLFLSDMGPKGGDEINLVTQGQNYGWPIVTLGTEYSGEIIGEGLHTLEGMVDPIYSWNPSIAPSGITFYDQDTLLVSALAGRQLIELTLQDNKVLHEEKHLLDLNERIRDVIVTTDKKVLVISDEGSLILVKLE